MADGHRFEWSWQGRAISLGVTREGRGPAALLLPAPSSICDRGEMLGLQQALAPTIATLAIDLPGFGSDPKPPVAWSPAAYRAFLADVAAWAKPVATVAAGHMAVYALERAAREPGTLGKLAMVAPTWRGPLPTMMKRRPPWLGRVADLADRPLIGPALYRLNVNGPMIALMAREHVYADRAWLSGSRLAAKRAVTDARGARHASVRFVTGLLDPADSRAAVLGWAGRLTDDVLLIHGDATPRKSLAEMEALATLPRVRRVVVAGGKLAVHEEMAEAVAAPLRAFFARA